MSERARVLGIIALASLPLLLLGGLNLWQGVSESQERVNAERVALARAAALTASQAVAADFRSLRIAAGALARQHASVADVRTDELVELLDRDSNLGQLILVGADGWNISASDGSLEPRSVNVEDRGYFQDARAQGSGISRAALPGRISGEPVVVLTTRLETSSGELAVLAGTLFLPGLGEDLRDHLAERGLSVLIVDAESQVILPRERDVTVALPSLRGRVYVERALAGSADSVVDRTPDGEDVLVAFAPIPGTPWALLVQQPASIAFAAARRDLVAGMGLLGLAALLAIAIGAYLGTRLSESYERERAARTATERYAAELQQVSAESEQRRRFLERLIVSAPIPIAITQGPRHQFLSVNPHYQLLKPGAQMVGRTMAEVFPELEPLGVVERLDQVYRTGRQFTAVDQSRTFAAPAGEERYFTIVYAPYDDAEGHTEGVLIIALETSDAVRTRLRAEREKDEFLSTASHELKTPLTAIALAAQMIERVTVRPPTPENEERLARSVRGMIRQVHRAGDLINDLLEVSRLQRGGHSLRREPVNLILLTEAAVERTVDLLTEESAHKVSIQVDTDTAVVLGDETRLDQMLTNLLSNAIKYSPEGGPVSVRLSRRDDTLELRVVDHGMGVAEDERDALFRPFSRAASARESSIEGTGLGLYITRQIVESHGGAIRHEPTPGGGATFIVELPAG